MQRMFSISATLLSLIVATILSPSCSNPQPANDSSWSVRIKTSGGFAGTGNGNVLITSDGKIRYEPPHAPGKQARPCVERLSGEELRAVREAVGRSKPEGWKLSGLNAAAPDAFGYDLELRRGGKEQVYQVKWYDNTREQLPEDLKRLSEAVNHAMNVAAKKCGG